MAVYDEAYLQETLRVAFENPTVYKIPKGIIRYDYGKTHGWWVRVTRDGVHFRKIFSDSMCESIQDGLRKAIVHRHEILAAFPVTTKHIHARALAQEPENRIQLTTQKRGEKQYTSWEAKWYDANYNVKSKGFSVIKYGYDEAKALALSAAGENHNKKRKITSIPDLYQDERYREILRADVDVLATINSGRYARDSEDQPDVITTDAHGYEGEKKYAIHLSIERDKKLREQKLKLFINQHGKLFCELCSFRFAENYPFLAKDIIEVHHIVPLSTLTESSKVTPNDLMLLCANCHLAIHQGDAEANLLAAMAYFENKNDSLTD